ncbi:hypothetical protein JCGZ_04253 [Jatropha curcas]|uniref:Trimethylguanosine synthase n=1 Tax=Jatropha curcas TaxID=180498 RepID=A0A067KTP4_JATCU|nr:hypothetical protein JCGZ_04253 [Jatropha curcas]
MVQRRLEKFVCFQRPPTYKSPHACEDKSLNFPASSCDFSEAPEDIELTKQMDALGLPLSFLSNKETRNKMNQTKRKGTCLKPSHGHKDAKDEEMEITRVSEVEIVSPNVLHDNTSNSLSCMSMLGQSESYYYDVAAETSDSRCPAGEDLGCSTTTISGAVFDGTSLKLSKNGQEDEIVTLNDFLLTDESMKGLCSGNSDAAPSPPCSLTDASLDHDKKGLNRNLMEYECLKDFSVALDHEKCRKFCGDSSTEQSGDPEIVALSYNSEILGQNGEDNHGYNDDLGDWRVYWDSFYMRNYFHNIKTGTSTWDPPTGMEHLAFEGAADRQNVVIAEVTENDSPSISCALLYNFKSLEEPSKGAILVDQPSDQVSMELEVTLNNSLLEMTKQTENNNFERQDELHGISTSCDDETTSCLSLDVQEPIGSLTVAIAEKVTKDDNKQIEIGNPATDKLDTHCDSGMIKQKKKARKVRANRRSSNTYKELQCQGISEELSANIGKYWCQRYLLFSRFDSGIKMDEEGWFSVTPEPIARHHALRCASDTIIDCFTGVGGNAIQFANMCKHVTAIDVDAKKIDYAYHNAAIYGVDDQIDFIKGDFFILAPNLKADTVFLSPPWGGPDYAKVKSYNIKTMLKPHDGYFLFNTAKKIACRIVMFLPRNVDLNQLAELSLSADHPWYLEVEKNFLNGKLKAITAYFSDLTVEADKSP